MGGEIVEDDDIAWRQRRGELGFHPGVEDAPVHLPVDDEGGRKFSCRECEMITQPPAPIHVTSRGFAGPNLLAMILFEKFAQQQPLNRQSERYTREGIDLSLSTLADRVGVCAAARSSPSIL